MRNAGHTYREQVGPAAHGRTLLDHLATTWSHSSAEQWRDRIASGTVRLDDEPAPAGIRLCAGQWLTWHRPPWDEPAAPLAFSVLHEDAELLAVAKPAGLPTLPGGSFLESTLLHRVRCYAPGASPLHRLGRFTSGIVLFAKTRRAHESLSRQWRTRKVYKRYRASALGDPTVETFEVRVPIGPVAYPPLGTVHAASPSGREAMSRVTVIERRGDSFLCDVEIATGRPHQIRIHLAAAGHPLFGDPLYGPGGLPRDGTALPGDPGYLLHATELRFAHPTDGRLVQVRAAPPPELQPNG